MKKIVALGLILGFFLFSLARYSAAWTPDWDILPGNDCTVASDCGTDTECKMYDCIYIPFGTCHVSFAPDGTECATGTCQEGVCTEIDCNDANMCTQDLSIAGDCVHISVICSEGQSCDPNTGVCIDIYCDDSSMCTEDDMWVDGVCTGTPIICNDNNVITIDTCDPETGCVFTPMCIPSPEVCDGVDNDCDGEIDEGVKNTFYLDDDEDGYGNPAVTIQACSMPEGYVDDNTDCDDTNFAINPGNAEIACNGFDDDCDLSTLENPDADGDGYFFCTDDCDDSDAFINPGSPDMIDDGIDQDCDGMEFCYKDSDDDGYRDYGEVILSDDLDCFDFGEASASDPSGDCNDNDASINPGALDIPLDGIDQDCDTFDAEFCEGWTCDPSYYANMDGCDCGCGCWDPDCDIPDMPVSGCSGEEICIQPGLCELPPPEVCEGWTCDPSYYANMDGCDCGCGCWDPDCDIPDMPVSGCSDEEICIQPGLCELPPGCGNSVIEESEECDDGNIEDLDGCSSDCTIEDISTHIMDGDDPIGYVTYPVCSQEYLSGRIDTEAVTTGVKRHQLKIEGKPECEYGEEGDDWANEQLGLEGRFWCIANCPCTIDPTWGGCNIDDNSVYLTHKDDPDFCARGYIQFDCEYSDALGEVHAEFLVNGSYSSCSVEGADVELPEGDYPARFILGEDYSPWGTIGVQEIEFRIGDCDYDGISDDIDNCPGVYNPSQEDPDYDGLGSACDDSEIVCIDNDADGHYVFDDVFCTQGDDCDDSDDTVYPGAEEIYDAKDNDCDSEVDELENNPDDYFTRTELSSTWPNYGSSLIGFSGTWVDSSVADALEWLHTNLVGLQEQLDSYLETDPIFSAWDRSTGIVISESQISDLDHFTNADETDPVFSSWDKSYDDLSDRPDFTGWDTDSTDDQMRVSGVCPEGSSIRLINPDGTVVCEEDTDTDTDTVLSEAEVDAYVADNGYLTSYIETDPTVPSTIKDGIDWSELSGMPADIADGDDDTIYDDSNIKSRLNALEAVDTSGWDKDVLDDFSGAYADLSGVPTSLSDFTDDIGVGDDYDECSDLDACGYLTSYTETDSIFSAWDRSTGIVISESQISDLDHFTNADETDPVFSSWDKSYDDLTDKPDFTGWDTDSSDDQLRVSGNCPEGSSIRLINADGSVVCEEDTDTVLSEEEVDSMVGDNGYLTPSSFTMESYSCENLRSSTEKICDLGEHMFCYLSGHNTVVGAGNICDVTGSLDGEWSVTSKRAECKVMCLDS